MIDVLHRLVAGADDRDHLDALHCSAGKGQAAPGSRRDFLKTSAALVGTFAGLLPALRANGKSGPANTLTTTDELARGFFNPPDAAKPQTWWHWREGRISTAGLTAELEALHRIGVGGVTMFSVSRFGETGPKVPCLSEMWHERVRFAMRECDRLGLTFNFQNCAGWSGSGGPWITPDIAMQHVVHTPHAVAEGATLKLDAPPSWP